MACGGVLVPRWTNCYRVFTCADPGSGLAIDRVTHARLPFETVKDQLREQLRRKYHLRPADGDEFKWACLNAGTEEFQKKFGDGTRP